MFDGPVAAEKNLVDGEGWMQDLFARMPQHARDSFTPDQMEALRGAARTMKWGRHPIDIRISLPTLFSRYYLVVVSGKERRSKERRSAERKRHPVKTWRNAFFAILIIAGAFYLFAFLATLFFSFLWTGPLI